MDKPSDRAIAQAIRNLEAAYIAGMDEEFRDDVRLLLDYATQPAAAGELPEAVALVQQLVDSAISLGAHRMAYGPGPNAQKWQKETDRIADQLRAAVAGYRRDADLKVCTWSQEDEQCDCFDTSCGHTYMVNDAETGGMKFCTFCGGDMKVAMWTPDDDDDAALANLGSGE